MPMTQTVGTFRYCAAFAVKFLFLAYVLVMLAWFCGLTPDYIFSGDWSDTCDHPSNWLDTAQHPFAR